MTDRSRAITHMVAAIRSELDYLARHGATLCIANSGEDTDFVVHVDGRIVSVDSAPAHFTHVDQIAREDLTERQFRDLRWQVGCLIGSLSPVTPQLHDSLVSRLLQGFGADGDLAEKALTDLVASPQELFDLLCQRPGHELHEGDAGLIHEVELVQDVSVSRLVPGSNGGLAWETQTVAKAGEKLQGYVNPDGWADMAVPGGRVVLRADEFTAQEPAARRFPLWR